MILKELADLARREGLMEDPDYEPRPVRWIIGIGRGGKYLGVTSPSGPPDPKGKVRPKVFQVPRSPVRTSGSFANFLVDKPEYALGYDPDDNPKKLSKLARHRAMFREYVESAMVLAPDDRGLSSLLEFLRDDAAVADAVTAIRQEAAANDLIAFRYSDGADSGLIHDRDEVRAAWKKLRHPAGKRAEMLVECLGCGLPSVPVDVHPQVKRVPGGSTSGIALVSANAPAFESFALSITESAPVCRDCADAYGTALNRLFHPQYTNPDGKTLKRQTFRLSEDTAVIYWASGADEHQFVDEFGDLDFVDPAQAGALFEAVDSGKGVSLNDPTPFHALIVTGGQGRATLRGYFQSTVGEVAEHLRTYFDDIEIVRRFENSAKWPALSWLVRSLAPQGEFKNVDPDLAGRLFLAILGGAPFPREVLAAAVRRIRAEKVDSKSGKHSRERLALIRATLNRLRRKGDVRINSLTPKEITVVLDPECRTPAYGLGRLFAVLEKLQADAIGDPGASIADRFYGAASATPAAVFATLLRKAQHHQAKLDGAYYPRLIQEVLDLLPAEPFPSILTLEEQGLFALGYYHQKAELWRKKAKPEAAVATAE
ncbi:type I-C CRISPR-associated protein Cas8c/Csd1 [Paludisphaera sp.]|uniref:type I-C CRISPR-associated protein Cas8c/Csd1 n=1 Tax=Paludisphaera sp. TaxID=2017432 RepID=UPI00301D05B1